MFLVIILRSLLSVFLIRRHHECGSVWWKREVLEVKAMEARKQGRQAVNLFDLGRQRQRSVVTPL